MHEINLVFFEICANTLWESSVLRTNYSWNAVDNRTFDVRTWKRFRSFCTRRKGAQLRGRRLQSCRHHYGGLRECLLSDQCWVRVVNSAATSPRTMSGGSQHNPNGRQSQLGPGWSPLQVLHIILNSLHTLFITKHNIHLIAKHISKHKHAWK